MSTVENGMSITSFNGYEILEILPRGGMSTVYKARQLSLDRIVAIKALPPAMGAAPADVEKFMAEARTTAGLKHPNIVQVYDFGKSEDGVYYFVMEYISGYSVAAWIRRKRYLSEENSLLCALSIAAAMNYAWQKAGIVHCDIKPDNVIIDGDGTVKLGDLGLATSVKSIFGNARSADRPVFGTPNYISPEQSRGDDHLDCRADIYSLGAMLYHCMTGTMPFEGMPPLEAMDRQITDQIPDPQDVNPRISVWSACLIEKMMAKDRNYRQKDWAETIHDLSRARSEMMPQGMLPPEIKSTIKRSAMRDLRLKEVYPPAVMNNENTLVLQCADNLAVIKKRLPAGIWRKTIISTAGIALLLAVGWSMFGFLKNLKIKTGFGPAPVEKTNQMQPLEADSQKSMTASQKAQVDREHRAWQQYEQAMAWFKANPAGLSEAVSRFRKLADETSGTKYADMARQEAKKLERSLAELKTTMAKLDKNADSLAAQNRFMESAAVYEKYQGPYERETAGERKRKAQSCHAKQNERLENERRRSRLAEQQVMQAADEIAMILVEDGVAAALGRMKDILSDLPLISAMPKFKNMTATLEKSAGADRIIIDSFRMQKDQEINIVFLNGTQKMFIREVRGDLIAAEEVRKKEQGTIVLRRVFTVKELALAEKFGRIGNGKGPEFALMRVILAVQDGDYQQASAAAIQTGPLLSKALGEAIAMRYEWRASQALAHVFRRAGIYYGDTMPDPEACLDLTRNSRQPLRKGAALNRAVGQFRSCFGPTETARRYDAVLETLINTNMTARDKRDKTAPVPASPNQRGELSPQFKPGEPPKLPRPITDSIVMKMIEQNSGLREDQIAFQANDSGRIVRVEIVSTHLRDIKALENMADIQQLICAGVRQNVWLEMPVIAPLSDLTPLKKMSLRELILNHTRVKDISVLSQMPLATLNLAHTKVNDLQPLQGMPLKSLDLSFTPVRDIRPLAGLPLAYLNISGTEVSDLSPLLGMPLKMLSAVFTKIRDLTPLRNMPLYYLAVRNTEVADISPLKGMPLEFLDLADTRVRDISVLWGMNLRELDLNNTRVKYLDGLEQMPLENLKINGTGVRDIAPLKNMPLKSLDLRNTGITDLTPIQNSFIEEIWLDDLSNQPNNEKFRDIIAVLQTMPKLKSVNGKSMPEWSGRNER